MKAIRSARDLVVNDIRSAISAVLPALSITSEGCGLEMLAGVGIQNTECRRQNAPMDRELGEAGRWVRGGFVGGGD